MTTWPKAQCLFSERFLERIAVFAATPWEFHAVARALPAGRVERVEGFKWWRWEGPSRSVAAIRTGVGPAHAQAAPQVVFAKGPWTAVISSGFAGALIPSRIGDLVIPEEVVTEGRGASEEGRVKSGEWRERGEGRGDSSRHSRVPTASVSCSALYRRKARDVAQRSQSPLIEGRLVTVGKMVWLAEEKQVIGRACDASSLDMESAVIGAAAMRYRVPFVVVRAISDLVDETLPLDLNLFCRPATFLRGAWTVLTTPRTWPALYRLHRQQTVASCRLTRFFTMFFQ